VTHTSHVHTHARTTVWLRARAQARASVFFRAVKTERTARRAAGSRPALVCECAKGGEESGNKDAWFACASQTRPCSAREGSRAGRRRETREATETSAFFFWLASIKHQRPIYGWRVSPLKYATEPSPRAAARGWVLRSIPCWRGGCLRRAVVCDVLSSSSTVCGRARGNNACWRPTAAEPHCLPAGNFAPCSTLPSN